MFRLEIKPYFILSAPQMNAVRGGTVTWRPQPWQDGDGGGGEPLSDSDSEEEDFPDDSTTPLGDYITHGEDFSTFPHFSLLLPSLPVFSNFHFSFFFFFRPEAAPGRSAAV